MGVIATLHSSPIIFSARIKHVASVHFGNGLLKPKIDWLNSKENTICAFYAPRNTATTVPVLFSHARSDFSSPVDTVQPMPWIICKGQSPTVSAMLTMCDSEFDREACVSQSIFVHNVRIQQPPWLRMIDNQSRLLLLLFRGVFNNTISSVFFHINGAHVF